MGVTGYDDVYTHELGRPQGARFEIGMFKDVRGSQKAIVYFPEEFMDGDTSPPQQMAPDPDQPFGRPARARADFVEHMTMGEQDAGAVMAQEMLPGAAECLGRHEIVIPVDIDVFLPVADQSPGDLRMGLEASLELEHPFTVFPAGQRFEHIAEKHHPREIRLEEFEKAQELVIIMTETVGLIPASDVKIRDNRNFHNVRLLFPFRNQLIPGR